jgi:hypothetical protein
LGGISDFERNYRLAVLEKAEYIHCLASGHAFFVLGLHNAILKSGNNSRHFWNFRGGDLERDDSIRAKCEPDTVSICYNFAT